MKERVLLGALALFVGFIYGSHHIFIPWELDGEPYEPVTIAANRDEGAMYGPRANAVYYGDLVAGDISVAGNERGPSPLPILNPIILGGLGRLTGSLRKGFILSDFLFPPFIFLALYALARELFYRRFAAILFAAVFVFMPKIFLAIPPVSPSLAREFVSAVAPDPANLPYFSRFEYPKITFFFFTLALFFAVRALRRGGGAPVLWAGLSFGALFYTYLYDWVYVTIGLAFTSALFLFQKKFWESKRLLAVIGIGLAVSVPYWINFFELINLPHYGDVAARLGSELGRQMRLLTAWKTYARSAALIALVWFLWRKRERLAATVLAGFLPVIAVVLNLQVVLGFNPQPDHWHRIQFLAVGLGFFAIGLWAYDRFLSSRVGRQFIRSLAGIIMAFIFGSALYGEYAFSRAQAKNFVVPRARAESYKWLREYAPRSSTIVSNSFTASSEFLLYTSSKSFLPNGFNTTISNDELWERFMLTSRIFDVSKDDFQKGAAEVVGYLFVDAYRDRSIDAYFREADRELPNDILASKTAEYGGYVEKPAADLVDVYRMDYIYFAKSRDYGSGLLAGIESFPKVFENEGVVIYSLH